MHFFALRVSFCRKMTIFVLANCGCSSVVEHRLPKPRAAGSTPVTRSNYDVSLLFDFGTPVSNLLQIAVVYVT